MSPILLVVLCIAIVLGVWHLNLALQAIFVFRADEPILSWIAILTGPLSTLPAALIGIFFKSAGGYWLVGGGLLSFLVFAIGEHGATDNLGPYLARIALPMIISGVLLVYLPKRRP